VLTSLALMAAPSGAANEGNSANAKLCQPGGYPGVLFNQQGEVFKNARACTKYAAKGGRLAGVSAVAEPASGGRFNVNCSGFGLKPNGFAECGARWEEPGFYIEEYASGQTVVANGTWSASGDFPCEREIAAGNGQKRVTSLVVNALAAAQGFVEVRPRFPPPTGC
jgi:hypothetical protein